EGRCPCLECRAIGNSVEPVTYTFSRHNGGRLASEYQEGGLESVFAVVVVSEDTAAHGENHRAMAPHEGLEGSLLPPGKVAVEQLPIRQACPIAQNDRPKLLDDQVCPHAHRSVATSGLSLVLPGRGHFPTLFFSHSQLLNLSLTSPADRSTLTAGGQVS